jgi:hypothetical protein
LETLDLFTAVTRYNQAENRFTASLVYILEMLWNESKDVKEKQKNYYILLDQICGKQLIWGRQIDFLIQKYEAIENSSKRILDFEIRSLANVLVWVEVKDTAPLQDFKHDKDQLNIIANRLGYKDNRLVVISRYPIISTKKEGIDNVVTWYMLYKSLKSYDITLDKHSISHFLLTQFLKLLKRNGVYIMKKVNKDIVNNLENFFNLLILVKKKLKGCSTIKV